MNTIKSAAVGRNRGASKGRRRRMILINDSIWRALELVAFDRSRRLKSRITRPDVLEELCLSSAEVSRELRTITNERSE